MTLPLLNPLPVLLCASCGDGFAAADLALFRFDAETMTCHHCLTKLLEAPRRLSCFGKVPKGRLPGYDPDARECREVCQDRNLCRSFVEDGMAEKIEYTKEMREAATRLFRSSQYQKAKQRRAARNHPFPRRGTIIRHIWDLAIKGTTVEKIQKVCAEIGANPQTYLRQLRREFASGHEWKFSQDEEGQIRITYPLRQQ